MFHDSLDIDNIINVAYLSKEKFGTGIVIDKNKD